MQRKRVMHGPNDDTAISATRCEQHRRLSGLNACSWRWEPTHAVDQAGVSKQGCNNLRILRVESINSQSAIVVSVSFYGNNDDGWQENGNRLTSGL
jgi:hypothetical protein